MNHIHFRASTCGRFIVSLIGQGVRVLTIEEAIAIRDLYREKELSFRTGTHPLGTLIAAHEAAVADLLDGALTEASEIPRLDAR